MVQHECSEVSVGSYPSDVESAATSAAPTEADEPVVQGHVVFESKHAPLVSKAVSLFLRDVDPKHIHEVSHMN